MRVLLSSLLALAGINVLTYAMSDASNVTVIGWIALGLVIIAICLMATVALNPSRQIHTVIREMMAVASIVMSLLATLGLSDTPFREVDEVPVSIPLSTDGPFRTIGGEGTGKIILVIKEK